jgi:hypothetical protein
MARGVLAVLAELALVALCLPAAVRAQDTRGLPLHLRDTGLYVAGSEVNPDARPFSPQYPLWSDGAGKRRWIWLPPGAQIDASRPDAWDFPRGTKLWKEFAQGRAIETRFITRGDDGQWRFGSYVWNAEGTDAVLAPPRGIRGAHVIPSESDCRACHEAAPAPVLGFSALQLSPDRDPLAPHADQSAGGADLRSLVSAGLLRNFPAELLAHPPRVVAADPVERAALGYLHGNCGHCHNDDGPLAVLDLALSQRVSGAPSAPRVLQTLVGVASQFRSPQSPGAESRISPGHGEGSVLLLRMASRDPLQQMPPLGSAAVDPEALALLQRWIEGLSN